MNLCVDCSNIVLAAGLGIDQVTLARCKGNVSEDRDPVTGVSRSTTLPYCSDVRIAHKDCPWFLASGKNEARDIVSGANPVLKGITP